MSVIEEWRVCFIHSLLSRLTIADNEIIYWTMEEENEQHFDVNQLEDGAVLDNLISAFNRSIISNPGFEGVSINSILVLLLMRESQLSKSEMPIF